jgi:hypothetical protein
MSGGRRRPAFQRGGPVAQARISPSSTRAKYSATISFVTAGVRSVAS